MKISIRDISARAVALGALTDIVSTNVVMVPVAILVLAHAGASAATPAQRTAAFTAALSDGSWLYLVAMVLGCAASVLGGWVAARLARRAELLNGSLSAAACVGFGIYGALRYPASAPAWQHAAFLLLSPCLGALGGMIWKRQANGAHAPAATDDAPRGTTARVELRGVQRAVYVVNRVLAGLAAVSLLFFGLVGLYGYSVHQAPIIIASVTFCVFVLLAGTLLLVAGRMLRAGRQSHWAYHGGALVVASIPAMLLLLSLTSRHRAG